MANGNVGEIPATTFAELLSGSMLDIYVGESKRHWTLHRNLLYHHSEKLELELQGDGDKKLDTLQLPDHDPAGFELLVKWLYQGKLDDVSDIVSSHAKYDYAVSCHQLYLLCDRFDMPQLKNVAMDQYRKGLNEAELVPDAEEIKDIYRKSPAGSPFRVLMTRIAARQIMDPDSARDVGTYRECFEANPDFALDLVSAIKLGTGGMLFDDPTDGGSQCEYHDHDGTNCHIKGKGKTQALKATIRPRDPNFAKYDHSTNIGPRLPHRHPPRLNQILQPPPRQARSQDGVSVGPLRRRLTSPAFSTVGTSTENILATLPSPKDQRDKSRRVTYPKTHLPTPAPAETLPQVPEDLPQNSAGGSPQVLDRSTNNEGDKRGSPKQAMDELSPRRNIWEWARVGTGRLGIVGRIPHPEWKGPLLGITTSKAATSAVTGALDGGNVVQSQDDFSVPSSTSTEPESIVLNGDSVVTGYDGFEITNGTEHLALFSQTRSSSDDLVASMNETPTPSPRIPWKAEQTNGVDIPLTPSPAPRNSQSNGVPEAKFSSILRMKTLNGNDTGFESTPSPRRIPTYKIAFVANILNPSTV